jgi:hypothetical protein
MVYKNELSKLQEWNDQLQRAMNNMTEMNTAFRQSLGRRFEVIYAHQELISDIERLSAKAGSLARGSNSELGFGMSDLATELRALASSARLMDTN